MDERFHRRVPKAVETEEVHLLHSLFGGPFFDGHAIRGDENAGAIVTKAAVHEDFLARIVAEKKEKLSNLFIGWRSPAIDGNVDEAHAERFGVFAFPLNFFAIFAAQIHDGSHAQHFQFSEAHFSGLCPAVQDLRDFPGIPNSVDVQFLSVRGLHRGRNGCSCIGLRGKSEGQEKKEQ